MLIRIMMWAIIALLIAMPVVFFGGRWLASRDCDNRHNVKQLEHTVEVKKKHEAIDKKIPYSADRAARFKWLRQHSRK